VGFLSKKLAGAGAGAAAAAGGGGEGKAGAVGNAGQGGGGVFCYVNSVFAPGLDEGVGGLWKVGAFTFLCSCGLGRRGYMRGLQGGWERRRGGLDAIVLIMEGGSVLRRMISLLLRIR